MTDENEAPLWKRAGEIPHYSVLMRHEPIVEAGARFFFTFETRAGRVESVRFCFARAEEVAEHSAFQVLAALKKSCHEFCPSK